MRLIIEGRTLWVITKTVIENESENTDIVNVHIPMM